MPTSCVRRPVAQHQGIGNFLRHQYDRVDLETVWHTVTDHLPPLKASVTVALKTPEQSAEPNRAAA